VIKEFVMIKAIKLIAIVSMSVVAVACSVDESSIDENSAAPVLKDVVKLQPCSSEWFSTVEDKIMTDDGHGHGPDLGSSEWRSVIEFRLGIRGRTELPARNSAQWCDYIDKNYIK